MHQYIAIVLLPTYIVIQIYSLALFEDDVYAYLLSLLLNLFMVCTLLIISMIMTRSCQKQLNLHKNSTYIVMASRVCIKRRYKCIQNSGGGGGGSSSTVVVDVVLVVVVLVLVVVAEVVVVVVVVVVAAAAAAVVVVVHHTFFYISQVYTQNSFFNIYIFNMIFIYIYNIQKKNLFWAKSKCTL
jgi:hypothetical protein